MWTIKFKGQYKFKKWIHLESIKEKVIGAVENKQVDFPNYLLLYLSTALGVSSKYFELADWDKIVLLFYLCISKSPPIKLPLTSPTSEKYKEEPWNYEGRIWHVYSHLLASNYGWSLEYISQLQVQEALATIQEILVDTQLEHEFYYGLSEIAYPYDKNTKKSIFKPLDRPHWMRPKAQPIPRFKIPKAVMPMGNVIMDNVLSNEFLPKEI